MPIGGAAEVTGLVPLGSELVATGYVTGTLSVSGKKAEQLGERGKSDLFGARLK